VCTGACEALAHELGAHRKKPEHRRPKLAADIPFIEWRKPGR
jgi:hypothetical protein